MKTILILLAFCTSAFAGDLPDMGEPDHSRYKLSTGQTVAESAFVGLMYTDYRQTKDIKGWCVRHNAGQGVHHADGTVTWDGGYCDVHETNALLGKNPSDARIRNYFIGGTALHAGIAKALPNEWRPWWIGGGIVLQLHQVIKNKQFGLSINIKI
jgi:hypothetical protein